MIRKLRLQKLLPFLTLTILFVALWIASPYFMTAGNLSSIIRQTAVINIMALGMTVVIIAGGIDLSVGSMLGFASVLGTIPMENHPMWVGILAGIAAGAACGAANGAMVTALRINPFIVTLGTMGIFRGLALLVSKGVPINKVPVSMRYLADGDLLGVPFVLWILALCAVAMHVMLEHTRLGRYAFSIGSNADAAFYAGVPVAFVTIAVFAVGGLLTGLASMIGASRLMSGQPTGGESYELSAIAAVVIGGGSLRGGEGSGDADRVFHHGPALERHRPARNQSALAARDHRRGDYHRGEHRHVAAAAYGGVKGGGWWSRYPSRICMRRVRRERDDNILIV